MTAPPRVLIVGENASMRMGGEASFPYFYFKLLRERGVEAWLVTHGRCRDELRGLLPGDFGRIRFVGESRLDVLMWRLGDRLPRKLSEQTIGVLRHLLTQRRLRRAAVRLIREEGVEVVHEATPISPKSPSVLHGLGVPVVVGPLCGGMDYPPAFQYMQGAASRLVERVGRASAHLVNRLAPGKLHADSVVVAHAQTRAALPHGVRGAIYEGIPDIGVDTSVWKAADRPGAPPGGAARFAYLGRLVDWKGVDLLLEAFRRVVDRAPEAVLEVIGDGPDRRALEAQAGRLGLGDRVVFAGWVTAAEGAARLRAADAFVLPSLRECGGSVVLEAMALGLPVVVTRWGGPGLYVDDASGVRVDPSSREAFVAGLADGMVRLAESPDLRAEMGLAARRRIDEGPFAWGRKVDRFLEIYRETIDRRRAAAPAPR